MKLLEGKRLAFIFGAYAGIFALYVLLPTARAWIFLPALILTALFSVRLFFSEKPRNITARKIALTVLMCAAMVGASMAGAFFTAKTEKTAEYYAGGIHTAEGYITAVHYEEPYGASYELTLTSINGKENDIGTVLTLPYSGGFSVWDTIRFEGEFSEIEGEFALYRKADGVWFSVSAETAEKTGETERRFDAFFENIRLKITKNLQKYINETEAGFASALLTGDRTELAGGIRLAFTRLGVSHLLAVSGLHLAVIVGGADMLLRLLTVPKKKKDLLLVAFSVFFACICGLSSSVLRAAIMLSVYYLSDIFGEKSDSATSLFFALFIILVCNPNAVCDIGLWLSFLSTLGILTVMPLMQFTFFKKLPRILGKLCHFFLSSLMMTLAAAFFTMPVTYLAFGGLSLVSPLANLIFVPITQILLYLLVLLTLFGQIPVLAPLLGTLAEYLISLTVSLAERLSDIKDIYISIRYPFAGYIIAALALGILAVLFIKKLHPSSIFAVFLFCTLAFACAYGIYSRINADASYLYLQTDGKSDMLGIVSGGDTMLVDITTGGSAMPEAAYKDLADFYECEIDTYVLTHYHRYHANTLRKLSENIKIHRVLLPQPTGENDLKYYNEIVAALKDRTQIQIYENGTETVGGVTIALPERSFLKRSSHPVISFSASVGENGKRFSYLSSSALEIISPSENIVVLGAHGPADKHIFDASLLDSAELILCAEKEILSFTETERIGGMTVCAEEYGGYFRIAFCKR